MPTPHPSRLSVLVVDDSPLALQIAHRVLAAAGYQVTTVATPFHVLKALRDAEPDLILLDVNMPALRGDRLLEVARREGWLRDAVVVFYSDRPESELAELTAAAAADGFVRKTSDQKAFIAAVGRWAELARSRRAQPSLSSSV